MRRARGLGLALLALLFGPLPRLLHGAGAGGSRRFAACSGTQASQKVVFLHVGDLHAGYNPDSGGESPYARLRGYYEQVRAANPCTLLVDAGDEFEKGSLAEELSRGAVTLAAARALCCDVRMLGNHDFAWSPALVREFSRDPCAATLASNMRDSGAAAGSFGARDYVELEVGCLKIGFFGMLPWPWNEKDEPFPGRYYPEFISRYDFIQRAREIVRAHRRGVQLMVMVSHLGLADDERIAAAVPGIDVILGGHTHDVLWDVRRVKGTLIVHAGQGARYLARLELAYDLAKSSVTRADYELVVNSAGALPVSAEMNQAVARLLAPYASALRKPIAPLKEARDAAAMGDILARAAARVMRTDAALADRKTIVGAWRAGGLVMQDIFDAVPVEREPPGTTGVSGFYAVVVRGGDLARVRDGCQAAAFSFVGPARIDPRRRYRLALPKKVAYNASQWFPGARLANPAFAYEAWQVLAAYGAERRESCLYLDVDERIAGCR